MLECFNTLLYRSLDSNTEFMTFPVRFALLTRVRQCFPAPSGASSWWHSSLVLCACTAPQEAPRILPPKASWTLFTTSSLGSLRKAKESFQTHRSCHLCAQGPLLTFLCFIRQASYSQDGPSWCGAQHCLFLLQLSQVYSLHWTKCIYNLRSGSLRSVTQGNGGLSECDPLKWHLSSDWSWTMISRKCDHWSIESPCTTCWVSASVGQRWRACFEQISQDNTVTAVSVCLQLQ